MLTFIVLIRRSASSGRLLAPEPFAARLPSAEAAGDAVLAQHAGAALLGVGELSLTASALIDLADGEVRRL